MKIENQVREIVRLWNSGEKDESKKLFMKVQMAMSPRCKLFLKDKMKLCFDQKGIYIYKKQNETNI